MTATWADFDNDGDLDLYVVNSGNIKNESNTLYENLGDGTFLNIAATTGTEGIVEGLGESVAVADYDNDGFIDMLVLNGFGNAPFSYGRRVLLHNEGTPNHWLQIKLLGTTSNRDGIGSKVSLKAGQLSFTTQQTGGMHNFAQNSQIVHFGLGNEDLVDRITVHWPDGCVQQISNICVNQRILVQQPAISLSLIPDPGTDTIHRGENLGVTVALTNHTEERRSFFFTANVTLPNGILFPHPPAFLFGPTRVNLPPHATVQQHIGHDIPLNAPLGKYIYNAYVGDDTDHIWNEHHFEFAIEAAQPAAE